MATRAIDQSTVIPDAIDPNTVIIDPPAPPRSALGEVGAGIARGALVGLPSLAGRALQYVSEPGRPAYEMGRGMVSGAEERGQRPGLTLHPEAHNAVTNAIAAGGEMLAPSIAVPAAVGLGAAAAGFSPFLATGAAALAGGALFGADAGQQTLDKAKAAGLDDGTAREAARLNAATTVAAQAGLGMIGGHMLGTVGRAAIPFFKSESASLASQTLAELTGTGGVVLPALKRIATGGVEGAALNAGQAALSAGIERSYGLEAPTPGEAAADSVAPTLGLTALMGPLALVTRALNVRAAKTRTEALANPETPADIRTQLAQTYAERLQGSGMGPGAGDIFAAHANEAIRNKAPLPVDSNLLDPTWRNPELPAPPPAPLAALPFDAQRGVGTLYVFPDGSTTRDPEAALAGGGLPEQLAQQRRAAFLGYGEEPGAPPPTLREAIESQPPNTEVAERMRAGRQAEEELTTLHEQVRSGLQDAGIEPARPLTREEFAADQGKGMRGQALAKAYRDYLADPATQVDIMRRDADAFDQLQRQPAEEPIRNPLPDAARTELPAEKPTNPAMAEALTAAIKKRDEARAAQEADAKKQRELDAIQNVSKGAELADAAERGEVQGDANAPKAREAIEADWSTAMAANDMDTRAQSKVPFMKRLDATGVFGMKTHAEQIAALDAIAADKKVSQGVRDRASMLSEQWKKDMPAAETPPAASEKAPTQPSGGERPSTPSVGSNAAADAAAHALAGEPPVTSQVVLGREPNIPEGKPQPAGAPIAGKPAEEVVLGSNLPAFDRNMPVTDMAEAIGDRVAALRAEFSQRIRSGEQLSALEKERYEDLNDFARAITRYQDGRAKPRDVEMVKTLGEMVEKAGQPYTKSQRLKLTEGKTENSNDASVALEAVTSLIHTADGVMGHLTQHGSEPWVRDLAKKLQPLMGKTAIERSDPSAEALALKDASNFEGELAGYYDTIGDKISIYKPTEATILHEAVHAATESRMQEAEKITKPATQRDALLKRAYDDLVSVYEEAKKRLGASKQYGMQDVHEFVAELHANDRFRSFLDGQGLLSRVWDGIRRLLGMQTADVKLLQRALDASEPFFSNERIADTFDSSPEGAARGTDMALARVISRADERAFSVDTGRAELGILKGLLPLQTLNYIGHRVRTNAELLQSGFSSGVDAMLRANTSHEVIVNRLKDVGAKYVTQLDSILRPMGEAKARALQTEMMTIGGEASRIGFDYRKNGRDNIAADKSIDPANKEYIDEIHRRYTQLQKSNPEVARMLEDGERINLRSLIEKTATIAANLMDDRAGRARHLEAELMRMDPADARRAQLQDQVKLVTTESLMAQQFAKGLDLLDATLGQGKNPNPTRFHDTATANLGARLQRTFDAARALPDGSPLKEAMGALESIYAKEAKHPYFSLGRDGDFFVKVAFRGVDKLANDNIQKALDGSGKVVGDLTRGDGYAFFRVRTAAEAQALHDKLVGAGQGKVQDTAWGRIGEKTGDLSGISPALRTLLSRVDDMQMGNLSGEQANQVKMALTRQLLSMLPETSARSASMGRRGIPGYDSDFLTQFAQRAVGSVHDTAGVYTSRAYMAAAEARKQAVEALNKTGSADARQRASLIDDELNKRYSNMMRPMGRDWVSNLTSLSHSFYLGLSPAFFIRSFAQPWQRGLPFVGSKYGWAASVTEFGRAQATALKIVGNSFKAGVARDGVRGILGAPLELDGLGLNDRETNFLREMHANGMFDLGESSQLLRMTETPGNGRKMRDAMRMAAVSAQYSDMANRAAVGLAAFRLAEKRPQLLAKGVTPEAYALLAMRTAMDDFSPANSDRATGRHGWAGPLTPLFAQFQKYNLQTMEQISRTVHDGFFGQDKSPEGLLRAKEARREFAGLMATTATIAGALGMPFANAFAGLYNTFMSNPDDPKDVRIAMRQWATDTFGQQMGAVLMKGAPSLLNLDTSTMGQQGILPGSDFLADRTLWKERSESQVRNALGPAVSLGLDLPNAVSKMMDGNWVKGIEAALPVGLRSFFKTGEMLAGDGYYTDGKGNPIPLKIGASDIAWRALGFQTESKSLQGEAQRDFIINQERLKNRKQIITDQFVKASRDPSGLPDAVQMLQGFNAHNPTQPITGQDLHSAVVGNAMRFALGEASGTGIPVTKRQLPALMASERHAAMPGR